MPMLKIIAAIDEKRGIARHGSVPWYLPLDLKYFKRMTISGEVIMGRMTHESIGRPLSGRENIIITSSKRLQGVTLYKNLQAALDDYPDAWIIGGERIFYESIDRASELYLTHIDKDFNCDRFFPEYEDDFRLFERSKVYDENGLKYYFAKYERMRPSK